MTKDTEKPILVIGATGTIGREVMRALLEREVQVRVFVRSPEKVASLPPFVERFIGNLLDHDAVERAFNGVHAAFFVSPHEDAEEQIAENIVGASERAGVRLVFSGVPGVWAFGGNLATRLIMKLLYAILMPHYAGKLRVAERVRNSRTDTIILCPGTYYQNDDIFREQILSGIYPVPLKLVPGVDTRDVGDAAARVLLDSSVQPGFYWVVGPQSDSGQQRAANWTVALGRQVRYSPDIELVDRIITQHYSGRKALDFHKSHRALGRFSVKTKPWQVQHTSFLLGRPSRTYADYARDVAAGWQVRGIP